MKEVFFQLKDNGFYWDSDIDFTSNNTFTSFKVRWNKTDAELKLDFVNDNAESVGEIIETELYYRTDCIRNMLSNKITAIYRFAAKDVVDIREIALNENVDWSQTIIDARKKEAGVDLVLITQILTGMPKEEFDTIAWVKKPDWKDFQEDIKKIAFDMLNG
jgi:hypothetical protein